MPDHGRYLYAVTRDVDAARLTGATGIDDRPLDLVAHRGLEAVVSDVDLESFGEDGLRRNLEDLAWLERVARRHDDVVHEVARLGPAAPMRLATVCLDDDGVRRRLDEWHEQLVNVLERIAGRSEWSVKVVVPTRDEEPAAVHAATGAGAGAAYLQRKKQEGARRAQAQRESAHDAEQVYTALSHVAVAGRRLAPQDPRLSGHQGTMTLNAAFLVDDADESRFTEAVTAAGDSLTGGVLQVGGPWPPYSFATLETT